MDLIRVSLILSTLAVAGGRRRGDLAGDMRLLSPQSSIPLGFVSILES